MPVFALSSGFFFLFQSLRLLLRFFQLLFLLVSASSLRLAASSLALPYASVPLSLTPLMADFPVMMTAQTIIRITTTT